MARIPDRFHGNFPGWKVYHHGRKRSPEPTHGFSIRKLRAPESVCGLRLAACLFSMDATFSGFFLFRKEPGKKIILMIRKQNIYIYDLAKKKGIERKNAS